LNRQVTEAFDALADRYEKETDGIRPYNAFYERPAMMRILPDDMSGLHVLDAGCAAGWYSEQLIRLGARVTAVDASPRMVEAAKRRVGDRADVRLHNLEDPLPFETEQFNWIVCSLSLHYLPDWTSVLAEFARVLKPNGRLLFSTHHPFMDFVQFDQTDYFAVTLLRDQWTAGDRKVEVPFYRRPFGRIFAEVLQWFDVEQVVEPQPVEELKRVDLVVYERLMTQPAFLIIQGRKKQTPERTERKRGK
jgi:SAM-dependent methyltransferase